MYVCIYMCSVLMVIVGLVRFDTGKTVNSGLLYIIYMFTVFSVSNLSVGNSQKKNTTNDFKYDWYDMKSRTIPVEIYLAFTSLSLPLARKNQ